MSLEALNLVFNAKIGNPSKKAVLMGMANHGSPDGKRIFPSVKRLSIYTGLSESTVRAKLAELREDKLIKIVKKAYRYRPTEYKMDLTKLRTMRHPGLLELEASSDQTSEKPIPDLLETDTRPLAARGESLINLKEPIKDLKDSKPPKKAKPNKSRKRDPMFDAIVEVCGLDPKIKSSGSKIGKAKRELTEAGYTAEQVLAYGQWWNSDEWRRNRGPPTVWKLLDGIGTVKTQDAKSRREERQAIHKAESDRHAEKRRRRIHAQDMARRMEDSDESESGTD